MAIGDYGNNNSRNSNKAYEGTYYSRLKFKSEDNKTLAISYRNGLMVIEIDEVDQANGFRANKIIDVCLSPIKANMLYQQINSFLEYGKSDDIDTNKAFGVNAGMNEKVSFIAFSYTELSEILITIGKFDGSGVITDMESLKLRKDYNYALEWEKLESNDLTKVYYDLSEITMLKNAIEDFSRSINGAYGYATADIGRYDRNYYNKRIDEVFDKLGIERRGEGGGGRSFSNNNFLSNAGSRPTSMEEVENLLD